MRVDGELLLDLGMVSELPANNAPHYSYGPNPDRPECEHTVDLPIRETYLWCPICATEGKHSQLKRRYTAPAMWQVWMEHWNPTTGRVESDRKGMERHMAAHSDKISESLGISHNFIRTDFGELKRDAENRGMDLSTPLEPTHDREVAEGKRESKGKYVWTLGSGGG